jgi:putative SOS response-associated peptidase YedK
MEQIIREEARAFFEDHRVTLVAEGVPEEWSDLVATLGAADAALEAPRARYNIAPTDWIPTLDEVGGERILTDTRWGVQFPPRRQPTFNARIESLNDGATWASMEMYGRIVHVLSGFYEWRAGNAKDPVYVTRTDGLPLLMAALSDNSESTPRSATITIPAPDWFMPVHDRIPLLMELGDVDHWLRGTTTANKIAGEPLLQSNYDIRPVHTDVNNTNAEGPALVRRRATLF